MKKIMLLLALLPLLSFGQIERTIRLKIAVMQNFSSKGELEGETLFWQLKGKLTYGIVKYTDAQNPVFKDLFVNQYKELLGLYRKMNKTESEDDTAFYVKTLIRQEEDYRNLLTKEQLKLYLDAMAQIEKGKPEQFDSYSSLFFSENLLKEYKAKTKP